MSGGVDFFLTWGWVEALIPEFEGLVVVFLGFGVAG